MLVKIIGRVHFSAVSPDKNSLDTKTINLVSNDLSFNTLTVHLEIVLSFRPSWHTEASVCLPWSCHQAEDLCEKVQKLVQVRYFLFHFSKLIRFSFNLVPLRLIQKTFPSLDHLILRKQCLASFFCLRTVLSKPYKAAKLREFLIPHSYSECSDTKPILKL